MTEYFEKYLKKIESQIRNYFGIITVLFAALIIAMFAYLINLSVLKNINSVVYDQVELSEYQACLEGSVSGTMWYWPKENALDNCSKYLPTSLRD